MNTLTSIYQDIAQRTAGDIYIGVVGPVRTGKSTFIKRFMETHGDPQHRRRVYRRERARDELPQSGSGRTIMTAEPKFVPEEAAEIQLHGRGRSLFRAAHRLRGIHGARAPWARWRTTCPGWSHTPWFDRRRSP